MQNVEDKFKRRIVHIDMDAFFASVEQRDFPELKGKPIAVGGGERGVVAAASYEARKMGVFSAMPSVTAKRKCPDLIFVKPRFGVYQQVSKQIMEIFRKYTPLVEPLSLDEAYLDISENLLGFPSAKATALAIKKEIFESTQLTASAGVSFNKFLAKIASGEQKPDGITLIGPEKAALFIDNLPIEKFFGVGKVTAEKMKKLGIHKGKDLRAWEEAALQKAFGKSGVHFYKMVHLNDFRPVVPDRIRKSIGEERTFEKNIESYGLIMMKLNEMAKHLEKYMKDRNIKGKTITVKIKYADFHQKTRSATLAQFTNTGSQMKIAVKKLIDQAPIEGPVRLLGISMSNLNNQGNETISQITLDF
jgi:DNA polymerase IV